MSGSTTKTIPAFQLSVDPIFGDHDQLTFSPRPPIKRDSGQPILIHPSALSRDQCVAGEWGSCLPHTPHPGPPCKQVPRLTAHTLIRAASANRETETEEGKTKMGFQNWATPPAFIEWCEREVLPTYGYDRFGLDACAEPHNAKAPRFLGPKGLRVLGESGWVGVDGLNASWGTYGAVWCNPGFSACAQWLDKAASEAERGTTSLVLTHACHGARWFGARLAKANAVYLINPRINFLPPEDVEPSSNNRDSYLWVFSGRCRPVQKFIYPNAWRA